MQIYHIFSFIYYVCPELCDVVREIWFLFPWNTSWQVSKLLGIVQFFLFKIYSFNLKLAL